ncbi:hypothetical protein [Asticcacaulis sp. AC402]|uniref:hypothetical protein n=1 Tax=Asticcacaulis sp. AC402 TaxID=1282361 RepID=UPI0003C3FAEB|nr:hypothetical protein [Asticcacaulis sp. AC402]ESQ74693.1 hypothetical protein ABAC402_13120 [Asticcacaulis sp. AC402]
MAEAHYHCSNCGRDMPPSQARCAICEGVDEIGVPVLKAGPAQPDTPPSPDTLPSNVIALNRLPERPAPAATPVEAIPDAPAKAPPPPVEPVHPAETPLDREVAVFLGDMKACHNQDMKIITLLGFPTAGKTFFLNRFKYEIQQNDSPYGCTPGYAQNGTFIASTTVPSVHIFEFDEAYEKFAIVDIPGEYFREYLEQEGAAEGLRPEVKAAIDAVFAKSRGLVILLPAEEIAFSGHLYGDFIDADGVLPWLAGHYDDALAGLGLEDARLPEHVSAYLGQLTTETIIRGKAEPLIAEENYYAALASYLEQESLGESEDFDRTIFGEVTHESRRTLAQVIRRLADHCRAEREMHTFISNIVRLPYAKAKSPPIYIALSKADQLERQVEAARGQTPLPQAPLPEKPVAPGAGRDQARALDLALMLRSPGVAAMATQRLQVEAADGRARLTMAPDQLMEQDIKGMKPLASKFSSRKYGFITAFAGLDKARINYRLGQDGVYDVIEWIFESLDLHSRYNRDGKLYEFIMHIKGRKSAKPLTPKKGRP